MKKLLITLISIFVFINIAFAQSAIDKKVDSLRQEKLKAEQALAKANESFRQNESSANYKAAKDAKAKNEQVAAELTVALNQQKKEAEERAKKQAEQKAKEEALERQRQAAMEKAKREAADALRARVLSKYPEYLGTGIEKILMQKFNENPNFAIKDIQYDSENNIFINGEKVFHGDNQDLKNKIKLWNEDPTLMADYRKILRAHHNMQSKMRGYIQGYFGENYTQNIPLACKHTISYVNKEDFVEYKPICGNIKINYRQKCPAEMVIDYPANINWLIEAYAPDTRLDETILKLIYQHIPKELVMVDGAINRAYVNKINPSLTGYTGVYPFTDISKYDKDEKNKYEKIAKSDFRRKKYTFGDVEAYFGCFFDEIYDVEYWNCNVARAFKNDKDKPWKNKIHDVKIYVMPDDYHCQDTLAKVAKYGL